MGRPAKPKRDLVPSKYFVTTHPSAEIVPTHPGGWLQRWRDRRPLVGHAALCPTYGGSRDRPVVGWAKRSVPNIKMTSYPLPRFAAQPSLLSHQKPFVLRNAGTSEGVEGRQLQYFFIHVHLRPFAVPLSQSPSTLLRIPSKRSPLEFEAGEMDRYAYPSRDNLIYKYESFLFLPLIQFRICAVQNSRIAPCLRVNLGIGVCSAA